MIARIVALSAVVLLAASARGEPPKAEKSVAKVAAPEAEHAYVGAGKRDPFQEAAVVLPPKQDAPCGTLCSYDLAQFKLKALVTGITTPLAGLEAPNGKVYIVDRGTRIGKRSGRVVEVSPRSVVVEEPCARESTKKCRTTLGLPVQPAPADEDLQRAAR